LEAGFDDRAQVVIEHRDGSQTPVIDASVHIFSQSNKDLRENFMREPFRSRGFPDYEMDWYGAPGGEYVAGSTGPDRQYPGSDPGLVGEELFARRGVDVAILHPMTRGIMPDRHLGTAIASAHNEMMVKRWLEHPEYGDKFRGTVRVNPDDIAARCARSTTTRTIRASCRSASLCSPASSTGNPSTGRCGKRRLPRTWPSRCTSRWGQAFRYRPRRPETPAPT
jgi:hypothetical protein